VLARWVLAGTAAVIVLIPIVAFAYTQRTAISWMTGHVNISSAALNLARYWAGPQRLFWPVFGLAAFGAAADAVTWRRGRPAVTPGSVALPWLVLPPAVLLVASQVHPVYDGRYVEYCLPALAILVAWGLTWLARLAAAAIPPLGRAGVGWLGWLPVAVILVLFAIALKPMDATVSLPSSRADNLGLDSRIVADNARPGDIVFFIPMSYRPITAEYPAQWRGIRDIALGQSPVASDTLYGIDVSPAELLQRFTHVTRVWVYTEPGNAAYMASARSTPVDKEEMALVGRMKLVHRWVDGDKVLLLYKTR